MSGLTPRQRVYATIRREPLDTIPYYLWFHPDLLELFGRRFGTSGFATEAALGNHVLQPWVSINKSMAEPVAEGAIFRDEFGIGWMRRGYHNMVVEHPLERADLAAIAGWSPPDARAAMRFATLERLIAEYGDQYFIGADVSGSVFEPAYHLRDMQRLLMDMITMAPEADALFERLAQFTTTVAIECARRGVDWIWLGDDVGTQNGMMFSPDLWRRMLKPRLAQIIAEIRTQHPEMIIAYHSCGSIRPIIPDLIEIGIDVLNPLQPMAADMDNAAIKHEFGGELTFMAGIDTQRFLAHATPDDVRRRAHEIMDVMGEGGGFIFAGSHTIQPDVPLENIESLLGALRERVD